MDLATDSLAGGRREESGTNAICVVLVAGWLLDVLPIRIELDDDDGFGCRTRMDAQKKSERARDVVGALLGA